MRFFSSCAHRTSTHRAAEAPTGVPASASPRPGKTHYPSSIHDVNVPTPPPTYQRQNDKRDLRPAAPLGSRHTTMARDGTGRPATTASEAPTEHMARCVLGGAGKALPEEGVSKPAWRRVTRPSAVRWRVQGATERATGQGSSGSGTPRLGATTWRKLLGDSEESRAC